MNDNGTFNTPWRKVASTIYRKPVDSKILGQVELDVTDVERFITEQRKKGLKITLTHIFVLILARGIRAEVPEFNTYVRRGRIVKRPSIDALVSVLQTNGSMGTVKVDNTDILNLQGIELLLKEEINKSRKGDENNTMQKKDMLSSIPWPFRSWLFRLYKLITIRWGMSIPFTGLSANSFGSFIVSNIGTLGLDTGFPALLPSANVSFVLLMGGVKKKPVVRNDEIIIRRIMPVTIAIDHRVADASHGGKLFRFVKHLLQNPEKLL
jgi:pyruvate dehydrogenase E2 component (dihydrolipoamide acetyltransferase)